MKMLHYLDDTGEDHLVRAAEVIVHPTPDTGRLRVTFMCCSKVLYPTPEEYAMAYSVKHTAGTSHRWEQSGN